MSKRKKKQTQTPYDALLHPDEVRGSLACGCALHRPFGDDSVALTLCSTHRHAFDLRDVCTDVLITLGNANASGPVVWYPGGVAMHRDTAADLCQRLASVLKKT